MSEILQASSTKDYLNKFSNVLDKSLKMFSFSNDVSWVRQMIVDELDDIIKEQEKTIADKASDMLIDDIDNAISNVIGDNQAGHEDDIDIPDNLFDGDSQDDEQEFQDIMNDGMPPSDEKPTPEQKPATDDANQSTPKDAPVDKDQKKSAKQNTPTNNATDDDADDIPPEQRISPDEYVPFPDDMPKMKRREKKQLGKDLNTSERKNKRLSPRKRQAKIQRLQKLQKKILSKTNAKTKNAIKPIQKHIARLNKEIKKLDKKARKILYKMAYELMKMITKVSIGAVILILGLLLTIIIITAEIGIPMMSYAARMIGQTLMKYAAVQVRLTKEYVETKLKKKGAEELKEKEQKKIRKIQAKANISKRPILQRIDQQIQQLQQS